MSEPPPHDPSTLFGEIRSLVQAPSSAEAWRALTTLIDTCEQLDSHFLDGVVLPYVLAHITSWPVALRVAPQHWVEALFSKAPPRYTRLITALKLAQRGLSDRDIQHMCQHPSLNRIQWLDLSHNWLMESGVEHLCRSSHVHHLTTLDLSYNQLRDNGVSRFAGTSALNRLHTLSLARNDLTIKGFLAMQDASFVTRLVSLDLSHNWLRVSPSDDVFLTHDFPRLQRLDLSFNQIGDRGVAQILGRDAARLPSLRQLILYHTGITAEAMEAVAMSPMLAQLTSLDLSDNHLDAQGLHRLMESSHLRQLEHLCLRNTGNADQAILALCDTPHLTSLRELDLSKTSLSALGADMFSLAVSLPELVRLDLSSNELGEDAIQRLGRWSGFRKLQVLKLSSNEIGASGFVSLCEALREDACLEELWLDHNQLLPRPGDERHDDALRILDLARIPTRVRRMSLVNCQLNDQALEALFLQGRIGQLDFLDLRYNAISDAFVHQLERHLPEEANLTLDLRYTNLTTQGILTLQHDIPQCHLIR